MSSAFFAAPKGTHASCEVLNNLPEENLKHLAAEAAEPSYSNTKGQSLIAATRNTLELFVGASEVPSPEALMGALNTLVFFYKAATRDKLASEAAFVEALVKHSSFTPNSGKIVAQAWAQSTLAKSKGEDSEEGPKGLSLGKVVGFDWKLGVGITSSACENIRQAFVSVVWKIADPSGQIKHHHMELSIADFKEMHQSFLALQNQLHS